MAENRAMEEGPRRRTEPRPQRWQVLVLALVPLALAVILAGAPGFLREPAPLASCEREPAPPATDAVATGSAAPASAHRAAAAPVAAPATATPPNPTGEPLTRVVVRLHGPSPRLCALLEVQLHRAETDPHGPADRDVPAAVPDAEGVVRFVTAPGRRQFGLRAGAGWRRLRVVADGAAVVDLADGAIFDVEPEEELAAIVAKIAGAPAPSLLALDAAPDPFAYRATLQSAHVLPRERLTAARELGVWTEALGAVRISRPELRAGQDVFEVDLGGGRRLAQLCVHTDVPEGFRTQLAIVAEPANGGGAIRIGQGQPERSAVLEPGTYRLRWQIGLGSGPVIDGALGLLPGERRDVDARAPDVALWTGTLVGIEAIGRPWIASVDGHLASGFADGAGSLPIVLLEPPRSDCPVELTNQVTKSTLPARILGIDSATRTFRIEPCITGLAAVTLTTTGLGTGRRSMQLASQLPGTRFPAHHEASARLLLLPGAERHGGVCEDIDNSRQVVRWFTVHHGDGEVLLTPAGRWVPMRLVRPRTSARVRVVGFSDLDPIEVGALDQPGEHRVFVADGTEAILVDLQPGGLERFGPEVAEIVIR